MRLLWFRSVRGGLHVAGSELGVEDRLREAPASALGVGQPNSRRDHSHPHLEKVASMSFVLGGGAE